MPSNQTEGKDETQSLKVITAQKTLSVRVIIFAKSEKLMLERLGMIEDDLVTVVKHYEEENTDEVQVHPLPPHLCPHCGYRWGECQCGRPHRSPAV